MSVCLDYVLYIYAQRIQSALSTRSRVPPPWLESLHNFIHKTPLKANQDFLPSTAFSYHKPTMVLINRWKKLCRVKERAQLRAVAFLCTTHHLLSSCISCQQSAVTQTFHPICAGEPLLVVGSQMAPKGRQSALRPLVVNNCSEAAVGTRTTRASLTTSVRMIVFQN